MIINKKSILRILREAILMLLVFTIASGIGYQSSKTIEQRENNVRDLRTFLYGRFGIELYYTLIERETMV